MTCKNAETFRARNVVLVLGALAAQSHALSLPFPRSPSNMYLSKPFSAIKRAFTAARRQSSSPTPNSNDTGNLWVIDTLYEGQNFYDEWDFFNYADPTNGMVEYVDRETAFRERLAYVTPDNKIVMKVDNTTVLQAGQHRKSVRIQSKKRYNGGLFIIDIERAPHACSAWPAFWTVGPNWPHGGEIDIFEGVHLETKNQATFHTSSGCKITNPQNFTGNLVSDDCSHDNGGMGCGLINDSVASFGAPFNAVGGGVFATRWDDDGVWGWFFHRSTLPRDITSNAPNPKNWGKPTVLLSPSGCPPKKYFWDHVIVFDITLCGDLAGPTYGTSGCPGTCAEQVMNPAAYYNASWSVNYVHVFRNSKVLGSIPSSAHPTSHPLDTTFLFWTALFACWVWRSFRTVLMN
ncbi:unnamed protein product [Rhizoctonia solani]|uniref:GH16 domain-containing protein n=1 Tax=Rhizoctonia solani TaxID=456999 RepID=A0A8H3CMQ0_9AGAM|nr:unnamed protein product [Rhizoctonia solani]